MAERIYDSRIAAGEELLKRKDDFAERVCPVCGYQHGEDYQVFGYDMRVCGRCKTDYLHWCPKPEELASYYNDPRISELNRQLWSRDRGKEFGAKMAALASVVSKESKIVELGCGPGQFIKYLNDTGYAHAVGVEVDREACVLGQESGVDVRCLDVSSDTLPPADVYLLYEVIEHVFEPGDMVKNIFENLQSGGRLIVTTPNADGADNVLVPPEQPARFMASAVFPPYHINAFSVKSLFHFALTIGFRVISIKTPGSLDLAMIRLHTALGDDNLSDDLSEKIQKIIALSGGSGHLEAILEKP